MKYYHASSIAGLSVLKPSVSEHGMPLVYLSSKRENVLVYLSNAVEKYCKETGFDYGGPWKKWGPYGFSKDGRLVLEEYYPDALISTYKGVSGYIYCASDVRPSEMRIGIPDAVVSDTDVKAEGVEFVPDAYEAILQAEKEGLILVTRFADLSENKKAWIQKTNRKEYKEAADHPEYRHFLKGIFKDCDF